MKAQQIKRNPEILYNTGHFRAEIEVAQKHNGGWCWSIDVWANNRGYGTPGVNCNLPTFPSRDEAIKDGTRCILSYLEESRGDMRHDMTGEPCPSKERQLEEMIRAIKATLRPRYIQLELF